jgi:Demethylmenaquinone methyltransferase
MTDIDSTTLEQLRVVSTATITTQLFKRGLRNTALVGLAPLSEEHARFVGEAFTLRYIPAREDLDVLEVFKDPSHPQRAAVEQIAPGQVLVIDCRGVGRAASIGEILATRLQRRGAVALVTDGTLRDTAGIRSLGLPTFAAGSSPTTNLAVHHAVDLQVPIGCAEVPVYPGDILVGDDEGVVCIPRHMAASVAADAFEQERMEAFLRARVEAGAPLTGTYPPNELTLAEYKASLEQSSAVGNGSTA